MANQMSWVTSGVDVSLKTLDIHCTESDKSIKIGNDSESIGEYLNKQAPTQFAVEPTNQYHVLFVSMAIEAGHEIYLVDALRVSRYRESIGVRVKTDASDAKVLSRYMQREGQDLRRFRLPERGQEQLMTLLRRRALVAKHKTALQLGLRTMPGVLGRSSRALFKQLDRLMERIDELMQQLLDELGYRQDYDRVKNIPGIGPLNAIALVSIYRQHEFTSANQFVAFMGMDIRLRDSGKYKGMSKLTKKGPSEIRRLIYLGAQAASRNAWMKPLYERYVTAGRSKIAAACIVARKLLRIAFSLLKNQSQFDPTHFKYA